MKLSFKNGHWLLTMLRLKQIFFYCDQLRLDSVSVTLAMNLALSPPWAFTWCFRMKSPPSRSYSSEVFSSSCKKVAAALSNVLYGTLHLTKSTFHAILDDALPEFAPHPLPSMHNTQLAQLKKVNMSVQTRQNKQKLILIMSRNAFSWIYQLSYKKKKNHT